MKPIFLLSLPRSGSTLLQRILSTNDNINSISEPWLLIPLLYTLKKEGIYSEYSHRTMHMAISELIDQLPHKKDDYYKAINLMVMSIYKKLGSNNFDYFVDKTPRYSLIVNELMQIFPDAKYIILWRNPLSIISSIVETWGSKRWNIEKYRIDLYNGMTNLISFYLNNKKKVHVINYENLINNTETVISDLSKYIEMEIDINAFKNINTVEYYGTMGDKSGTKEYKDISNQPLDKWKVNINNIIRTSWCKKYIKWLGKDNINIIGYDYDKLLLELSCQNKFNYKLFDDLLMYMYGKSIIYLELAIVYDKFKKILSNDDIFYHS